MRTGAVVTFLRDDEVIIVRVEGLANRRGHYEQARLLYTDLTRNRAPNAVAALTSATASF